MHFLSLIKIRILMPVLIAAVLAGCGGDSDKDEIVPTGTISGQVSPNNGCFAVRAKASSDGKVYTVYPSLVNGKFSFNLPVEQYVFTAYPVGGFNQPSDATHSITTGANNDLATFEFHSTDKDGFVFFRLDGTDFTTYYPRASASFDNTPSFLFSSGTIYVENFSIRIGSVNGPGSYPIQALPNFNATVTKLVTPGVYQVWSTTTGGSGTFTVSVMDTTRRRMSGIFSFTANPVSINATGVKTISSGLFTNVYYSKP